MKALHTSLLALTLTLTPTLVFAQAKPVKKPTQVTTPAKKSLAESLTGAAKADYDAGVAAYQEKKYAIASTKFEEAYASSRDARLLWNISVTERQLQNYVKARSRVREYLLLAEDISEKDKKDAHEALAVLDTLVTEVSVNVNQQGADISVDGEKVGQSPLSRPLEINNGKRTFRVAKSGFLPFEQSLQVGKGLAPIDVVLKPHIRDGRVAVRASTTQATIKINGKVVGSAGSYGGRLPSGSHQLDVSAPGYKEYSQSFAMTENGTRSFEVTLEKEKKKVPVWALVAGGALIVGITTVVVIAATRPEDSYEPMKDGNFPPFRVDLGRSSLPGLAGLGQ